MTHRFLRFLLACAFVAGLANAPAAAQTQAPSDDALTESAPASVALKPATLAPEPLMPVASARPVAFAVVPAASGAQTADRRTTLYIVGGVALAGLVTAAVLLLAGGDDGDDSPIAEPPGRP